MLEDFLLVYLFCSLTESMLMSDTEVECNL